MNTGKLYKFMLVVLALALLGGSSFMQTRMNQARTDLGLTRITPLENAPPILAFTTVALGGFRGLIANALWVRAIDMQDQGKYFEMVQLADWITKLQPHLTTVWVVQAWNMAYNISIKFQDPRDRWLWVKRGIELLRDDGLRWNPNETLIYRELAWFFQHKMGQYLDDAHLYYKQVWAEQMIPLVGNTNRVDFERLVSPKTDEEKERARILRMEYKMDPVQMKAVDDKYGPLDWRLPEAHAMYWAWIGLANAKPEELITLRRVIYQSVQLAFMRGRLYSSKHGKLFTFGPNLDFIENASKAYLDMIEQDVEFRDGTSRAYRNFLRDAVYFLYANNRLEDASRWFKVIGEKFPDVPMIGDNTNTIPGRITLEAYALSRVSEDVGETSGDRTKAIIEGLYANHFDNLALGFNDRAVNFELMARRVWQRYQREIEGAEKRVGLPALSVIRKEILDFKLGPQSDLGDELKAQLRTELGLPAEIPTPAPPPAAATSGAETNRPPAP